MRKHALIALTSTLLAGTACMTSTPIGAVDLPGPSGAAGTSTTGAAGTGSAGAGAGVKGPYVPSPAFAPNDQPFTNPPDVSGDWVGYFENYDRLGSDAVRFHFGVDASGNNTLSVKLGDAALPAPPNDAFQAWPDPIVDAQGNPGKGLTYPSALDGFTYTAHEVKWQGRRLKLTLFMSEAWGAWCGLQTSYPQPGSPDTYSCNSGSGYTCAHNNVCRFSDGPNAGQISDRNHYHMCMQGICDCNATGCGYATSRSRTSFDLTFYADHAYGSAGPNNVQLMPVAP
jgi:hypothetical protein